MTENEARQVIECIGEKLNDNSLVFYTKVDQKALDMAIQAIEEIQQYRAIGTRSDFIYFKEQNKYLLKENETQRDLIDKYEAIGTVEECKMAMGKVFAKKRTILHGNYYCCECGKLAEKSGHCRFCGQSLY